MSGDKYYAGWDRAVQEGREAPNVLTSNNMAKSTTPAPQEPDWVHCAYCDETFNVDYRHAIGQLKAHLTLCKLYNRIKRWGK